MCAMVMLCGDKKCMAAGLTSGQLHGMLEACVCMLKRGAYAGGGGIEEEEMCVLSWRGVYTYGEGCMLGYEGLNREEALLMAWYGVRFTVERPVGSPLLLLHHLHFRQQRRRQ